MKRALVISYFYPPYSSVGATRVSKMTRYLADAGWEPHVLTVDGCDLPETLPVEISADAITRAAQSFDLAALPRAIIGRRRLSRERVMARQSTQWTWLLRIGELYRHVVCFPDAQIGWYPRAVARGIELARTIRPDVILSSSLPNTSHLVARRIAQRIDVPWVAELRDLWTQNHNFRRVQPLRALEERLERCVLADAAALVTVSEVWAETLERTYGRPTFVVPNGYDPSDYPEQRSGSSTFTLSYTGMFYNGKQSVVPLFEAVGRLAVAGRIDPARFRLHFVGTHLAPVLEQAEARSLARFVDVRPPVSYAESLREQCSATALLFLDWFASGASGWYSAKIYEYLGAGRPILSIGPGDTVVSRLLDRTGAGVTCSTPADIAATIDGWLLEFEKTGVVAYRANEEMRRRFRRQEAAHAMAAVLDRVSGNSALSSRSVSLVGT